MANLSHLTVSIKLVGRRTMKIGTTKKLNKGKENR
jgi:hypothetical protein